MQYVSHVLPPAYVFESMRTILAGIPGQPAGLVWASSLAVLYILPACWFFARIHRHAIHTGLLARVRPAVSLPYDKWLATTRGAAPGPPAFSALGQQHAGCAVHTIPVRTGH